MEPQYPAPEQQLPNDDPEQVSPLTAPQDPSVLAMVLRFSCLIPGNASAPAANNAADQRKALIVVKYEMIYQIRNKLRRQIRWLD